MKKYSIFALALVLGCTLFTGCRRMDGNMNTVPPTTQTPTQMPTIPAANPTEPHTIPATTPNTATDGTEHPTTATELGTTDATQAPNARGNIKKPAAR